MGPIQLQEKRMSKETHRNDFTKCFKAVAGVIDKRDAERDAPVAQKCLGLSDCSETLSQPPLQ
jgi:hypothetical protein